MKTENPIESLPLTSLNLAEHQRQKLKELFPEVFTEGSKVDWDKLRLTLGEMVDTGKERFGMNWPGKADCFKTIQQPSVATLVPAREESVDFDTTENLFIEGDNLEVLKLLQKSYLGKVKMIYIDPPYNTGNDFIYPDNYSENLETYLEYTGQVDGEGRKFSTNTDTDGRFHSKWMNMMYPRLFLAKNLLRDDGVIFISISDEELHNLIHLCHEVFGEENYIDIFNWAKTETPPNLSKKSKKIIEYIVCYQKRKDDKKFVGVKKDAQSSNGLLNQSNKTTTLIFPENTVVTSIKDGLIPKGKYGTDSYDVELMEDTLVSNGYFTRPVVLRAKFKWTQENLISEISQGTIIRIPTMRFSPSYEKLEYDAEVPPNLINSRVGVGTNENAGSELIELMGAKVFDFPKPVSLIKYLIRFCDSPEDSIIMDFFAGSGTTAESVLSLNQDDNGKRRYICVQLPEPIRISDNDKEEDRKVKVNALTLIGDRVMSPTIAHVTKERIRRAAAKIKTEAPDAETDLGFRVFKLQKSNFHVWDASVSKEPEAIQQALELHVENIDPKAQEEAILFELLLKSGFELATPIEVVNLAGKTVYSIADGGLLVCLEKQLTHEVIQAMAEREP